MKIIHTINYFFSQSSSEDVGQDDGDFEEDDEPDQHWMTQHTVYASPETQDIC
jgi:hypothetical protein